MSKLYDTESHSYVRNEVISILFTGYPHHYRSFYEHELETTNRIWMNTIFESTIANVNILY